MKIFHDTFHDTLDNPLKIGDVVALSGSSSYCDLGVITAIRTNSITVSRVYVMGDKAVSNGAVAIYKTSFRCLLLTDDALAGMASPQMSKKSQLLSYGLAELKQKVIAEHAAHANK